MEVSSHLKVRQNLELYIYTHAAKTLHETIMHYCQKQ